MDSVSFYKWVKALYTQTGKTVKNQVSRKPVFGVSDQGMLKTSFHSYRDQGPAVQSIVSLTTSLRRQLVKYMPTKLSKSNTLLFFVEKM